jgi:hypothetical protein
MKLVIDRKTWLRGEGALASFLVRASDNKRCCVGFYAKALGIEDKDLTGLKTLKTYFDMINEWNTPTPSWYGSQDMSDLYTANDCEELSEKQKENKIISIFAIHGVEVEFIN